MSSRLRSSSLSPTELKRRFLEALAEFEKVTKVEGVAISKRDFGGLERLAKEKDVIIRKVQELSQLSGLDRGNAEVDRQLKKIEALAQANVTRAAEILGDLGAEKKEVVSIQNRLKDVRNAYSPKDPSRDLLGEA
jgi:flagellar biosynthesis/type III secretory pathway chaperone